MRNKLFAAWLCLILTASTFVMIFDMGSTAEENDSGGKNVTLIASEPFRINSNADFATSQKVEWGDGSIGNPWIIENFEIDGTGHGYGIYIGNTTDYFVVRNCRLHNASGMGQTLENYYADSGLIIYEAPNGNFYDNTFMHNSYGFRARDCENFLVKDNNASFNRLGFYVQFCDSTELWRNTAFMNTMYGFSMYASEQLKVDNNLALANGDDSVWYNTGIGITVSDCQRVTIANNSVISTLGHGLNLQHSTSEVMVFNNLFQFNEMGMNIEYLNYSPSINIRAYHNNFIDNDEQAYDGHGNAWDNGYPSGGNYWGDYSGVDVKMGINQNTPGADGIGDSAYLINGTANSRDRYPLMTEWFVDTELPVADAGPDQTVDAGTLVAFDGTGSIDNVGIVDYFWVLWHNGTSTSMYGPTPSAFTFWQGGEHEVILRVTDKAGNWDEDAVTVIVNDIIAPTADAGPDRYVERGNTLYFNGAGSTDDAGIVNYTWTFNDGAGNIHLYGVSPDHSFTVLGNFTVTLKVMDGAGNSGTDTATVMVLENVISADAGQDQAVIQGAQMTFDGSDSTSVGGEMEYTWTFIYSDSAVVLRGESPDYTFWATGKYTVTLNVNDADGNWDSDTVVITVTEPELKTIWPGIYLMFIIIPLAAVAGIILTFRKLGK